MIRNRHIQQSPTAIFVHIINSKATDYKLNVEELFFFFQKYRIEIKWALHCKAHSRTCVHVGRIQSFAIQLYILRYCVMHRFQKKYTKTKEPHRLPIRESSDASGTLRATNDVQICVKNHRISLNYHGKYIISLIKD